MYDFHFSPPSYVVVDALGRREGREGVSGVAQQDRQRVPARAARELEPLPFAPGAELVVAATELAVHEGRLLGLFPQAPLLGLARVEPLNQPDGLVHGVLFLALFVQRFPLLHILLAALLDRLGLPRLLSIVRWISWRRNAIQRCEESAE
jgi:hypothetical protein